MVHAYLARLSILSRCVLSDTEVVLGLWASVSCSASWVLRRALLSSCDGVAVLMTIEQDLGSS